MLIVASCIAVWLVGAPLLAVAIGRTAAVGDLHYHAMRRQLEFSLVE